MATELIPRGPVDIGGVPVSDGTHVCALYNRRAERDALLMPYLKQGLHRGDVCLCVTGHGESRALAPLMAEDGLELRTLQLLEPEDTYLRTGAFEPDAMIDMLDQWSQQTFADDPSAFARIAADMSWAAPLISPGFVSDLVGFESRVTRWVRAYPQVGMCLYDLNLFGGDVVIQAIKFHPMVWVSGVVMDNPYYLDPDSAVSGR